MLYALSIKRDYEEQNIRMSLISFAVCPHTSPISYNHIGLNLSDSDFLLNLGLFLNC